MILSVTTFSNFFCVTIIFAECNNGRQTMRIISLQSKFYFHSLFRFEEVAEKILRLKLPEKLENGALTELHNFLCGD